jgi:hypothetical protein
MTENTYADEMTTIVVTVPAHAPVLTWSEAFVFQGTEAIEAISAIPESRVVEVVIPSNALFPGLWGVRVRAGATEAQAQTVYDGKLRVWRGIPRAAD